MKYSTVVQRCDIWCIVRQQIKRKPATVHKQVQVLHLNFISNKWNNFLTYNVKKLTHGFGTVWAQENKLIK